MQSQFCALVPEQSLGYTVQLASNKDDSPEKTVWPQQRAHHSKDHVCSMYFSSKTCKTEWGGWEVALKVISPMLQEIQTVIIIGVDICASPSSSSLFPPLSSPLPSPPPPPLFLWTCGVQRSTWNSRVGCCFLGAIQTLLFDSRSITVQGSAYWYLPNAGVTNLHHRARETAHGESQVTRVSSPPTPCPVTFHNRCPIQKIQVSFPTLFPDITLTFSLLLNDTNFVS